MAKTLNTQPFAFFRLPWWAMALILLFLGLALFGERGVVRVLDASRHRDGLQSEVHKLEARNAGLKKEIKALRGDKKFIEDIARKELGMVGDNEIIFVFPRSSGDNLR